MTTKKDLRVKNGKPARTHSDHSPQTCGERFIKQRMASHKQDQRMICALKPGHRGQHRNASSDLSWDKGFQVDLELIR